MLYLLIATLCAFLRPRHSQGLLLGGQEEQDRKNEAPFPRAKPSR